MVTANFHSVNTLIKVYFILSFPSLNTHSWEEIHTIGPHCQRDQFSHHTALHLVLSVINYPLSNLVSSRCSHWRPFQIFHLCQVHNALNCARNILLGPGTFYEAHSGLTTCNRHFLFSSTGVETEELVVLWLQLYAFRFSNPSGVPLSSQGSGSGDGCLPTSQFSLIPR